LKLLFSCIANWSQEGSWKSSKITGTCLQS